ncbi:MAG TPA: hypothetical protein IAB01_02500 [Candidatus Avidesulfovibrio excrementigallinarum]|nr:hypothetical protein [Candidatus Avidesulfovibrio excrementigallinarum]
MKRLLSLLLSGVAGLVLCVSVAMAAAIETDYFTLDLPAGWTQPQPVQQANGVVVAVVQNTSAQAAVSITVTPAPLPAKDLATQTLAGMKSGGFTVSEPVASGNVYIGEFSNGPAKGVSYFGSNGTTGCVVTVLGASTDAGKALLNGYFKSKDSKMFPASF